MFPVEISEGIRNFPDIQRGRKKTFILRNGYSMEILTVIKLKANSKARLAYRFLTVVVRAKSVVMHVWSRRILDRLAKYRTWYRSKGTGLIPLSGRRTRSSLRMIQDNIGRLTILLNVYSSSSIHCVSRSRLMAATCWLPRISPGQDVPDSRMLRIRFIHGRVSYPTRIVYRD